MIWKVEPGDWSFLLPPPKQTPVEWCEANIYLPQGTGPRPGRIRFAPWWKEIINKFTSNEIEQISIMSGGKTGKTTALICASIFALFANGDPSLIVAADLKTAEDILDKRIRGIIRASKSLRHLMKEGKKFNSPQQVFGPGESTIKVATANSAASLASVSVRYAICDEVAKYPHMAGDEAAPTELATVRTTAYRGMGGKSLFASTPIDEDDLFHKKYSDGIISKWFFPCPYCGEYITPDFGFLKYDRSLSPKRLLVSAHLTRFDPPGRSPTKIRPPPPTNIGCQPTRRLVAT